MVISDPLNLSKGPEKLPVSFVFSDKQIGLLAMEVARFLMTIHVPVNCIEDDAS